ncbi:hypothetical protein [Stenotrophomonas sp.]|uniref:hypothetical protein n=1 Tax=Stenotrophomonas sp. TaxID=69392 RepID=UPI0029A18BBB|nr:hypothetical protein [Stenotrophomonas sp.]MDX3933957.1 hypothetical protein [Stenotrophomonas sp.]
MTFLNRASFADGADHGATQHPSRKPECTKTPSALSSVGGRLSATSAWLCALSQHLCLMKTGFTESGKVIASFAKLVTFLSGDRKYLFSRCEFEFASTTLGDFDQIVSTNALVGAFEDLNVRLTKYKPVHCKARNLHDQFRGLLHEDIRRSCLPIGIETFDGDLAAFFIVDDAECLVIKPWDAEILTVESASLNQYKNQVSAVMVELENQKRSLTPDLL